MNTPAPHYSLSAPLELFASTSQTYCLRRTLPPQPLNLPIPINLVILENGQLRLLALVLDFLRSSIDLLLTLLGTTTQAKD